MNATARDKPRWYRRNRFMLPILAVEIVGGWFCLNAQVVRGPTPESAASAGIAFINSEARLGSVRWERTAEQSGDNFGKSVQLVAYRGTARVATATVNSFLWCGWQLLHYTIEDPSEVPESDADEPKA
ncbi:hypothetical protein ACXR0O_11265 [Verrucomicrobiota bacterium sgz303538]